MTRKKETYSFHLQIYDKEKIKKCECIKELKNESVKYLIL